MAWIECVNCQQEQFFLARSELLLSKLNFSESMSSAALMILLFNKIYGIYQKTNQF